MTTYRIDTNVSYFQTEKDLEDCFAKWRVRNYTIESNVPPRFRNTPRPYTAENAVTVTFEKDNRTVVLSLDTQSTPANNLRAIFLTIDAMRLIDKRGLADVATAAYMQLQAGPSWWTTLGISQSAGYDEIVAAYKTKAREAHPDHGGSNEAMAAVNAARDEALRAIGR